jgi:hypothetical protein
MGRYGCFSLSAGFEAAQAAFRKDGVEPDIMLLVRHRPDFLAVEGDADQARP